MFSVKTQKKIFILQMFRKLYLTLQEFCTVCALGELDEAERIFKREPLCLQVKAFKYVSLLLYYFLMIVVATRADEIVFYFIVRNTILDFINCLFKPLSTPVISMSPVTKWVYICIYEASFLFISISNARIYYIIQPFL